MTRVQEKEIQRVRDQIDTYMDTVSALICLGHVMTWDDKASAYKKGTSFMLGRRLDTSPANRRLKSQKITPDLVVFVDAQFGLMAEAKASFSGTLEERSSDLAQLTAYDDDHVGWPCAGEKIGAHDVVLLVHYTRKGDAKDILDEAAKKNLLPVAKKFAGLCFARIQQSQTFMNLEHFWGDLSDAKFQKRLRPLPVPTEKVLPLHPVYLYDAEPPMPYLLDLAWSRVFSLMPSEEDYQKSVSREVRIDCTVDDIRNRMAETCGHRKAMGSDRQPEIPQRDWIKRMFQVLVYMKLAVSVDKAQGKFAVSYKKRELDDFIRGCMRFDSRKRRVPAGPKQPRRRRGGNAAGQGLLFPKSP